MKHKASLQSSWYIGVYMPSQLPPRVNLPVQSTKSTPLSIQCDQCIPGTFLKRNREVCLATRLEGIGGKGDSELQYGSWGEPGVYIPWYRAEIRKGERLEIQAQDISPGSSHHVSDLKHISGTSIPVTLSPLAALHESKSSQNFRTQKDKQHSHRQRTHLVGCWQWCRYLPWNPLCSQRHKDNIYHISRQYQRNINLVLPLPTQPMIHNW